MNKRERVMAILNHQPADKIPVDCGSMHSSGISAITYNTLKKELEIQGSETKVYDIPQQLAIPEDWYLERFQVDVIDLARVYANEPNDWKEWELPDGSPAKIPTWLRIEQQGKDWVCLDEDDDMIAIMPEASLYFDQTFWPLYNKQPKDFQDLQTHLDKIMWCHCTDPLWKNARDPDFFSTLRQSAKQLHEQTDFAITANYGSLFFELSQWIFRNDDFFIRLVTEKNMIEKLLDKLTEIHLERLEPFIDAVSPYAQVIIFGDDLGMQNNSLISPAMYRELFFPRHKEIFKYVKNKSHLHTFLHSCGAISNLMPDLIEAGLDIINPVQINATGMESEKLKREFGKDLVFWGGGVDTQHTLFYATEQKIRDEVRKNCEIFMQDGGFVFSQVHNILAGIPTKNIIAMYDEVNRLRY
jgi:uroporphyrinogen decarboxylase